MNAPSSRIAPARARRRRAAVLASLAIAAAITSACGSGEESDEPNIDSGDNVESEVTTSTPDTMNP